MAKLNDIRALAEETAKQISRSTQEWTGYLDTAARLYWYPFSDSLLIHAQHPDATACASMELWNGKMRRWIKSGSKGIALIDDRGRKKKLRYVFDISDTRLAWGGKTPFLWQIKEKQREAVRSYLAESYWLEGEGMESLPAVLWEIASRLVDEELEEAIDGLEEAVGGQEQQAGGSRSKGEGKKRIGEGEKEKPEKTERTVSVRKAFPAKSREELRTVFKELLSNSLFYVLTRRCGLNPMKYLDAGAFAEITEFGSLSLLSFLGDATNKLAEPVLIGIRKEMQKLSWKEAKKEVKQKEKDAAEQVKNIGEKDKLEDVRETKSKESKGREEQKSDKNKNQLEEGERENEIDLSPERGLPLSRSDHQRGEYGNREVRDASGNIFERTPERVIPESAPYRKAEPAPSGNRPNGKREDGNIDGGVVGESSGSREKSKPDGVGSAYERADHDGRRNNTERIDQPLSDGRSGHLSLKKVLSEELSSEEVQSEEVSTGEILSKEKADSQEQTMKYDLSEAEGKLTSALLLSDLPDLPGEEEQKQMIEGQMSALSAGAANAATISQEVIDEFLRDGGNLQLRVYQYVLEEHTQKEKAKFVQDSYGIGGSSLAVSGMENFHVSHDQKGLRLFHGSFGNPEAEKRISWSAVARRIDELIDEGRYLSEKALARMPDYEREYMAGQLLYAYRHTPQKIKDTFAYTDLAIQVGNKKEAAELLKDQETASALALGMKKILKALTAETKPSDYENLKRTITNFIGYVDGEYTIFPERRKESKDSSSEENSNEVRQFSLADFMDISVGGQKPAKIQQTENIRNEGQKRDKNINHHADTDNNSSTLMINLQEKELEVDLNTEAVEKINFRITNDDLGAGGLKQKFRTNLEVISLLKTLEAENRLATAEEQEQLSHYVGWGGIPYAFEEHNESWSAEYRELKEALTPEEYREARASTLNAFYTSPTIIKSMYEILGNMGLTAGNGLEPSCGIGNFMGLIPETMEGVKMYGVELDRISGKIAKQLYQKNAITIQGFETTDYPDSFFDFVIGNIPFGNYKVSDRKYDRYNLMIHDYFIVKSLDLVRPGGVVAVVTSSGTMDKQNTSVRQYLASRADLLGAIRLPNNAFQRNANTLVVADILFFQKRDRVALIQPEWVSLGSTAEGYMTNAYFSKHPEMVLGKFTTENTQYGKQEVIIKPKEGITLAEQLKEAASHIHGKIEEAELRELADWEDDELSDNKTGKRPDTILADPSIKNFSFARIEGEVYYRENSRMKRMELPAATKARVLGMVELREITQELIQCQMEDGSDVQIADLQQKLNQKYDAFTARYGLISSSANRRAYSEDSSYYLLASLEYLDEEGNLERKADIFTKRTIQKARPVSHVETASEALAVSLGERAKVDVSFMAELAGKTEDEIIQELSGVIFQNPLTNRWEASDEYLSGNVRKKLAIAREFVKDKPEFSFNVEYLEKVQPKDLEASEIEVRLGATWVKPEYIQQFMAETFQTPKYLLENVINVRYAKVNGQWNISGKKNDNYGNSLVTSTYGTSRVNAYRLLEDALNLRDTKIYDMIIEEGKEKRVLNKKETMLAGQKQEMIKEAFKEWIFKDLERREDLCQTYNIIFNSIRPREYNGQHIQFVGMNPEITLMPHQKNAIAHVLYGKNTLLAHCVGSGKTFQMIAAGMESRRLGLSQKNLYIVPNHLTEQWASDFLRLYPGANILAATKKDFEPANRKKFCSRIATGEYDGIIIGHTQFEKIPLSVEHQTMYIQHQISEIIDAISLAKQEEDTRYTVKQMEKTRKSLEAKLEKLNKQDRKDDVITFEQLGVDHLFVDESHYYKNAYFFTKMRNVAGIAQTDAQKCSDLFMKCQYLDELTGRRGITFATGTPVSNSVVELYSIMRYLQYDTLQQMGMGHFDSWAAAFGETVTAVDVASQL